jgi:hypothetical protein
MPTTTLKNVSPPGRLQVVTKGKDTIYRICYLPVIAKGCLCSILFNVQRQYLCTSLAFDTNKLMEDSGLLRCNDAYLDDSPMFQGKVLKMQAVYSSDKSGTTYASTHPGDRNPELQRCQRLKININ